MPFTSHVPSVSRPRWRGPAGASPAGGRRTVAPSMRRPGRRLGELLRIALLGLELYAIAERPRVRRFMASSGCGVDLDSVSRRCRQPSSLSMLLDGCRDGGRWVQRVRPVGRGRSRKRPARSGAMSMAAAEPASRSQPREAAVDVERARARTQTPAIDVPGRAAHRSSRRGEVLVDDVRPCPGHAVANTSSTSSGKRGPWPSPPRVSWTDSSQSGVSPVGTSWPRPW